MYSVCICRSSGGNPGKSSSSFTAYKAILQPLSAHDGFWLLVCGVSVALGIPVSALLGRFTGQKLAARKVLHILAVGACALAMWKLESTWLLWAAVAAVYPALVWLVGWKGFWEEDNRPAWGILWFPPAMLLAWFLSGQDREITALSMGILAFSDAIAAWVKVSDWKQDGQNARFGQWNSVGRLSGQFGSCLLHNLACRDGCSFTRAEAVKEFGLANFFKGVKVSGLPKCPPNLFVNGVKRRRLR